MDLTLEEADERLSFAKKHWSLDWDNVLFSGFTYYRCVSVWISITRKGPTRISISDGKMNSEQYVQVLNDFLLPFLIKNENMIFVQESNEVTKSELVNTFFRMQPNIKCINWPTNAQDISPLTRVFRSMSSYVDHKFPVTITEIKALIYFYYAECKNEPEFFDELFGRMNDLLKEVIINEGGPTY